MHYECTDKCVTPWGGMLQMKRLLDKTGIRKVLEELGLPEGRSNHRINVLKRSVPLKEGKELVVYSEISKNLNGL
ncbi:MAG: hypothetical protein NZ529_02180 [Cytophagaceae bacterium]|nr:hypothetical protein [Cytophagaceae bacterium]MDW8455576.1 hypothetical protein [Cytophagaceae bacterium]